MKAVIHQPQYFPYPGFFHKLSLADVFVIMDDVQYDKRFTNRNRIIASTGWTWITVPINKEHKFLPNMHVQINNNSPWQDLHWKKIVLSYTNAKYFKLYQEELKPIYDKEWEYMFDLNFETLKLTLKWLGIKIKIIKESELGISGKSTERLINVCKAIGADTYVSGVGGKNYLDKAIFKRQGINLEYQKYSAEPYPQYMSKSFVPDLSILDLVFNLGPDSLRFITSKILNATI